MDSKSKEKFLQQMYWPTLALLTHKKLAPSLHTLYKPIVCNQFVSVCGRSTTHDAVLKLMHCCLLRLIVHRTLLILPIIIFLIAFNYCWLFFRKMLKYLILCVPMLVGRNCASSFVTTGQDLCSL